MNGRRDWMPAVFWVTYLTCIGLALYAFVRLVQGFV